MLDTLSNRIDYLEKICQKVEQSKKRSSSRPHPLPVNNPTSQVSNNGVSNAAAAPSPPENHAAVMGDNKEMDLKKQTAADDSAEKKFSLSSFLNNKSLSRQPVQQQQALVNVDPATLESLKSILSVRDKLKFATLDLMDRVKKAEEGVLNNLK